MTHTSIVEECFKTAERTNYYMGKQGFNWELPRQIGVTTGIVKLAYREAAKGKHVVIAVINMQSVNQVKEIAASLGFKPHTNIYVVSARSQSCLRGRTVDLILGDCLSYLPKRDREEFYVSVIPTIAATAGIMINIDTTEG